MHLQKSKWALSSIVATYIIILAMVGLGLWIYSIDERLPYSYICWGIISAWCGVAMFFCPLELRVESTSVSVVFCARVKFISLHEVVKVERLHNAGKPKLCFGSAIFFGWWGVYRFQRIGRAMVYATNLDSLVRIGLCDGREYLISCSDPAAMVSDIRRAIASD